MSYFVRFFVITQAAPLIGTGTLIISDFIVLPYVAEYADWKLDISVMADFIRVLVKLVIFHSRGCGHPQDDVMPNFFPDSKGSILGLSNEVSFVSELY